MLHRFAVLVVVGVALALGLPAAAKSLTGMLLVANPDMSDPNFARSVVLVIEHNDAGAFGVIVNRSVRSEPLSRVLGLFGLGESAVERPVTLYRGGPVQPDRALVLHSSDFRGPETKVVSEHFAVTSPDIVLKAMAADGGPRDAIVALGYSGWAPGQLEDELARDAWIVVPADRDLVFHQDEAGKWRRAFDRRDVDL